MKTSQIKALLHEQGYEARRGELIALAGMLAARSTDHVRALLLEGPSGCGKSALAEALSSGLDVRLVVYQCHAWTDSDELFVGVDVVSAVAGDAANVRQPGALLRVAQASHEKLVVLLLDEIDKTHDRAEALLLDWLQSGRVPVQPGVHMQTRIENVLVIITSNGQRELSDALLRRCRRLVMQNLPVETQERILHERTKAPKGLVRVTWKAAREVAAKEGNHSLSLQEGVAMINEIMAVAENVGDVRESLSGWAARTDVGRIAADQTKIVSAIWAEVKRSRQ